MSPMRSKYTLELTAADREHWNRFAESRCARGPLSGRSRRCSFEAELSVFRPRTGFAKMFISALQLCLKQTLDTLCSNLFAAGLLSGTLRTLVQCAPGSASVDRSTNCGFWGGKNVRALTDI